MSSVEHEVERALGLRVRRLAPLTGGCVGEVYRAQLVDHPDVVVKVDSGSMPQLDIEGYMLSYLAENSALPVPQVLHANPALLVMEFISGASSFRGTSEEHAAHLLADLHDIKSDTFGLERDTLIGGLHQPNTRCTTWLEFFAQHRLIAMGRCAAETGGISTETLKSIDRFVEKLDSLIDEPPHPSLLHGDVWSANVLAEGELITGFVDPAIYYGHPEIELAFITLFNTFGDAFFSGYAERRGIADGFFEVRRDIYNVYPLLVHARLFGGGYGSSVEQILRRHGC